MVGPRVEDRDEQEALMPKEPPTSKRKRVPEEEVAELVSQQDKAKQSWFYRNTHLEEWCCGSHPMVLSVHCAVLVLVIGIGEVWRLVWGALQYDRNDGVFKIYVFPSISLAFALITAATVGVGVKWHDAFWLSVGNGWSAILFGWAVTGLILYYTSWDTEHDEWWAKGFSWADWTQFLFNIITCYIGGANMFICTSFKNLLTGETIITPDFETVAAKRQRGTLRKFTTHKKAWYLGFPMRWGVILHGAMMFFAFAINLWDLFDGTNLSNQIDDILKFPFFFLGITFLGALSVGVGLWMKSPPWILTAAIFSMLLFCGSLIVFIKMLITWKHIPEEDKPSWPKIVFLAVQMCLGLNNAFNCMSYRHLLLEEKEEVDTPTWAQLNAEPRVRTDEDVLEDSLI